MVTVDFVRIEVGEKNKLYPEFMVNRRSDLMTKGGKFYAFYNSNTGFWSTSDDDLCELVDAAIDEKANDMLEQGRSIGKRAYLGKFTNNCWSTFQKYAKSLPDRYSQLDSKIIFSNYDIEKRDYVTRKLPYAIEEGDTSVWDELLGTLYGESERRKIEWAIGAIISGDSKKIQKFIVIHGAPGTGKSTVLDIIGKMFDGYWVPFSAEDLGDSRKGFAMEPFAANPLIAIDGDGDLSKISSNVRLNMIVSHDSLLINEKFKSQYKMKMSSFLFVGTNKPVKITDSKSGLLRRLIDVHPTGDKIPFRRYNQIMKQVEFEYGAIADKCLKLYQEMGATYYSDYRPTGMMRDTNDIFNFLSDKFEEYADKEYLNANDMWIDFKMWADFNNVPQGFVKYAQFRADVREYFEEYYDRLYLNGSNRYSVYSKLKKDLFGFEEIVGDAVIDKADDIPNWLKMTRNIGENVFDKECSGCFAQLANKKGTPNQAWDECNSVLREIDTSKMHYVRVPENHIVIDFDIHGKNGEKDLLKNVEMAKNWPVTYAEVSKSGSGLHLHYIYDGDVEKLSRIYDDQIEIKVFTGKSSLRRKLSLCNNEKIAHINSGLPLKGEAIKVVNSDIITNEKSIRTIIKRNLRKEYHSATAPSVQFIFKILEDAYQGNTDYDVTDLRPAVLNFAAQSSHQAETCIKLVNKMHFRSKKFDDIIEGDEIPEARPEMSDETPIVFFDVEVFPNLFVICWKKKGAPETISMINPTPEMVRTLFSYRLIGFNNRDYDNHIIYAAAMGYSPAKLYDLSQRIIKGDKETSKNAKFGEAYNLSYTDVYDFASAGNKMSLKKWEIKLKICHLELGLPWDQPVPEELWDKVAEYCCNDVESTEKVFDHLDGDWSARQILAKMTGLTVNDTTNQHTIKLLCGDKKNPQREFVYTDLSKEFPGYEYKSTLFTEDDYIPGCKIINGHSRYLGEDPGEGGYKIGNVGYWENVALLDVASLHPTSAIMLNVFGDEITQKFKNLVEGRLAAKHIRSIGDENYILAVEKLGDIVVEYFENGLRDAQNVGKMTKKLAKNLANALKTAINSVYGLTSASFPNKLRDPRNKDNIVAKRGSLFMLTLKHKLMDMGVDIVHISTDSIKVANATEEIIGFIMDFGKSYGYTFELEAIYEKMVLVNDAVYIAKEVEADGVKLDEPIWTATGKQFQVPYVFKTLFSHEELEFDDFCETMNTTTSFYLDYNENLALDEHDYRFVGRCGQFTPVKEGKNGGLLMRHDEKNDKFAAATGTKGYRWMESDVIYDNFDVIDKDFYSNLADKAIAEIEKYVPFEEFVA